MTIIHDIDHYEATWPLTQQSHAGFRLIVVQDRRLLPPDQVRGRNDNTIISGH
jgi:hypothetical protein